MKLIKKILIIALVLFHFYDLEAHNNSKSILALKIENNLIYASLLLPFDELQLSFHERISSSNDVLQIEQMKAIESYIKRHMYLTDDNKNKWSIVILNMKINTIEHNKNERNKSLLINLELRPPNKSNCSIFNLQYDAIIHSLKTHILLVSTQKNWDNGSYKDSLVDISVIAYDPITETIPEKKIILEKGSLWIGFLSILQLGIKHIADGLDHILFLFVLLLPAPLQRKGNKWAEVRSTKQTIYSLLKVVTAFTIGHSITLIFATIGWLQVPTQPVEVVIAITILLTAIHAIRPILKFNEIYIAVIFGLVHGMAFANVLIEMKLDKLRTFLSILSFNLGIEIFQFILILFAIPFFIYLSKTKIFIYFRIISASLSIIMAIYWIYQRIYII